MSLQLTHWSLRTKFVSIILLVLLIPLTSIYLLMEVEKSLVENLKNNLLLSSKLIGLQFSNNSDWFKEIQTPSNQDSVAKEFFVFPLSQSVIVDGVFDDWETIERFRTNFHSEPLIKNDGQLNLLLSSYENSFYLSIKAIDNKLIYSKENIGFSSDQLVISFIDSENTPGRIFVSPFDKGSVVVKKYNEDIVSAENFVGYWAETKSGFNFELTFPEGLKPKALRVTHFDVDNKAENNHKNRVSSSGIELNPLVWPSEKINQLVKKIELFPGQRLWVLDRQGRVLSRKGNLSSVAFEQDNNNFLVDWLFSSTSDLIEDKRHSSTKIMSTLVFDANNGKSSSSIEYSGAGKYSTALAATPIVAEEGAVSEEEIIGVILLEENVARVQLTQRKALADMLNVVFSVVILILVLVIGYISRLSLRITRLKNKIAKIVDEEGRFNAPLQFELVEGDELDDLSNAFLQMGNKLYEYNDYLENLASRLSHELRTPIAIVRSSLDNLLLDDVSFNSLDESSRQAIQRALVGTSRLGEIINRMRQASGVKNAMQSAQFETVDFCLMLQQLVDGFSQSFVEHQFKFICNKNNICHSISTDLMAELLDKLLSNAMDFAKQDSVIIVNLIKTDKKLILSVVNEGEPIYKKDLKKIFQSLVSIRKNKSASVNTTPNLGLGLYLVKLIANFHGAKVAAENIDEPSGVKFNVIWDLK